MRSRPFALVTGLSVCVLSAGVLPAAQAAPMCFGRAATVVGTAGNDDLEGTARRDVIVGKGGNDTINARDGNDLVCAGDGRDEVFGGGGDDRLKGGGGSDVLLGDAGNDRLVGGSAEDGLFGGPGGDVLNGGKGRFDAVIYSDSGRGVTVNLAAGTAEGEGADEIRSVGAVFGSAHDDDITGNGKPNLLSGEAGDDAIDAGAGGDPDRVLFDGLRGGPGADSFRGSAEPVAVLYDEADRGVTVDLQAGTASGEGNDTLTNIDGVFGSRHADSITGDAADNALLPWRGNDDVDGGTGFDTVFYDSSQSGITASLASGTATGEGNDTLTNVENLSGSQSADTLTGDSGPNILVGLGGNDTLDGGAGNDALFGGGGSDTLNGGDGEDSCAGEIESNCETDPAARRFGRLTMLRRP
ncbi:MAG: calcium-binding protein [Actinomycetota bacterium]